MGVRTTAKVWEWSRAEGTNRLVMLALADHCDDEDVCYPGVERIARKSRVSVRTVQRALSELVASGELCRTFNDGVSVHGARGDGKTNAYKLIVNPPKGGVTLVTDNTEGGDKSGTKGVTNRDEGGDIAMAPKPSVEPSGKPPDAREPFASQLKTIFEIFHRRSTTELNKGEQRAWDTLTNKGKRPLHADDLEMVASFYKAHWPPRRDHNALRHALESFLNNFNGEVDKARPWYEKRQHKNGSNGSNGIKPVQLTEAPISDDKRKELLAQIKGLQESVR